ncbi:pentapeptide repeat protein [Thalassoporum mexicanum PCC 7367]|uniref:pentapeptide repeat-containing protein n=1 Tax=Thalassoporum mexicanum TaxID=3457544 RepID=UPI00029FFF29|nr:pentapeptide repeat-containing protein [Pseudanabaena sp. PCC 7367]AFY68514.1 pentapeptide repeat protein [Pseudanabaena sp. PCC 7367]
MKLKKYIAGFLPAVVVAAAAGSVSLSVAIAAQAEDIQDLSKLFNMRECLNCDLSGSGLVFSDFARFNLSGTDFSDANLSRSDLRGANLSGANLARASLLGAKLNGADLSNANLSGADLNGVDLSNANLKGANLRGADLRGAYLVNADLDGANMEGVYLRGAIGIPTSAATASEFYTWGVMEAQGGAHKQAIAYFNQSLEVDPDFAFSYLGRAISRRFLGDWPGAIEDSKRAEELFTAIEHSEGVEVSSALTDALENPPKPGKSNSEFGAIVNTIGSMLLQFLL